MSGPAETPYTESGEGVAVVCSHGMLMDRTMFDLQLDSLGDRSRVIAYDSRARTENWQGPYSLYDLAEDAKGLLDRLEIERCVLVGMSMGGFMALRFALQYPDRLHGMVLIGASARPYTEEEQQEWRARYSPARDEPRLPRELAEAEAPFCFGERWRTVDPGSYDAWIAKWATYPGEAVWWETLSWIEQDDIRSQLGALGVPVMLIHGSDDTAVPLGRARDTAEALEAELVEVPDAGHTPNLERPDPVNEGLAGFLQRVEAIA